MEYMEYNDTVTYRQARAAANNEPRVPDQDAQGGPYTARVVDFEGNEIGVRRDGFWGDAPLYYVHQRDVLDIEFNSPSRTITPPTPQEIRDEIEQMRQLDAQQQPGRSTWTRLRERTTMPKSTHLMHQNVRERMAQAALNEAYMVEWTMLNEQQRNEWLRLTEALAQALRSEEAIQALASMAMERTEYAQSPMMNEAKVSIIQVIEGMIDSLLLQHNGRWQEKRVNPPARRPQR